MFGKGVSLTIPDDARPSLFDRLSRLLKATSLASAITGTVVLAIAVHSYDFFCTARLLIVYTRMLTLHNFPSVVYYFYLALYNAIYVIPLSAIALVSTQSHWAAKGLRIEHRLFRVPAPGVHLSPSCWWV